KKGTLKSLGLHRRMQTAYHRHSLDIAGKILFVKELVEEDSKEPVGSFSVSFRPHLIRKAKPPSLKLSRKAVERDEVFILLLIYLEAKRQEGSVS
ncbi:hypothetical protein JOM56_000818, partial [Amanita muscaria]